MSTRSQFSGVEEGVNITEADDCRLSYVYTAHSSSKKRCSCTRRIIFFFVSHLHTTDGGSYVVTERATRKRRTISRSPTGWYPSFLLSSARQTSESTHPPRERSAPSPCPAKSRRQESAGISSSPAYPSSTPCSSFLCSEQEPQAKKELELRDHLRLHHGRLWWKTPVECGRRSAGSLLQHLRHHKTRRLAPSESPPFPRRSRCRCRYDQPLSSQAWSDRFVEQRTRDGPIWLFYLWERSEVVFCGFRELDDRAQAAKKFSPICVRYEKTTKFHGEALLSCVHSFSRRGIARFESSQESKNLSTHFEPRPDSVTQNAVRCAS